MYRHWKILSVLLLSVTSCIKASPPLLFITSHTHTHTHTCILLLYWGRLNRRLTWYLQYVHHTHIAHMHLYPEWGFLLFFEYLFISLAALGLSCSMWDLVLWPGMESRASALGLWSVSHWTTGEVPKTDILNDFITLASICTSDYLSALSLLNI